MRTIGVSFTHEVGQRMNRRAGLSKLLAASDLEVEPGDVVEVRLQVTPRDQVSRSRRIRRELRRLEGLDHRTVTR